MNSSNPSVKRKETQTKHALFISLDSLLNEAGIDLALVDWKASFDAIRKAAESYKPKHFHVYSSSFDSRSRIAAHALESFGGTVVETRMKHGYASSFDLFFKDSLALLSKDKNTRLTLVCASNHGVCAAMRILRRFPDTEVRIVCPESSMATETVEVAKTSDVAGKAFHGVKIVPAVGFPSIAEIDKNGDNDVPRGVNEEGHYLTPKERTDRFILDFVSGISSRCGFAAVGGVTKTLRRDFGFEESVVLDRISKLLKDGYLDYAEDSYGRNVLLSSQGAAQLELLEHGFE